MDMSSMDQMHVLQVCGGFRDEGVIVNPWPAVYLVEAFILVAALQLLFQLICGSLRRRTNNLFIHGELWLGYTLLPPLITYTLGLMHSSTVDVVMYPIWALSLLLVASGANSITAYDLDDNKQWKRHIFYVLQCNIYFCIILFRLLYPSRDRDDDLLYVVPHQRHLFLAVPVFILLIAVFVDPIFGVIASWMVNYSDPSKVVADYMKDHAKFVSSRSVGGGGGGDDSHDYYFSPVSMKGCKYMVRWPYMVTRNRSDRCSTYRCEVPQQGVVTIEMIWDKFNTEYTFTSGVSSARIRGACLAHSLSHLLMRRYFGMDCAEANLVETRQFVLEGLLSESNTDEYTEAFKVIEVELAFLYDFFYTKYAVVFGMEGLFFPVVITKIICSLAVGVLLLFQSRFSSYSCSHNYIIITPGTISVIITGIIFVSFLSVEALQFILYLGSDWAMVSLACCYITGKSSGFIPLDIRKRFGFLISKRRRPLFRYWQKKLGQYSVIESSKFFRSRKDFAFESNSLIKFLMSKFIAYLVNSWWNIFSSNRIHFVELPDILKPQIVSSLRSSSGHLTNGKASLQRSHVFEQLSWTLQNETQTENMLTWHIATDYCRIASCGEATDPSVCQYRELATKLSCYCAYLISNAPELLPGNSVDTKFTFDHAMYQAKEALGSNIRNKEGLQQAIYRSTVDNIFIRGLQLGKELENLQHDCWKVMADFWIETILYIAPSENAKGHMEHLARGGEFLTHLWALLTHAGILTRDQPITIGDGIA
ncbi:hypothetical protein HU200_015653 [Digitaria exilis]|uniref:DUF4220 domain-containing protein n=1 Tax=Digitaria exilis TaxID=1010633 RepID=A0A835F851_9POAL|nr:hypothetical protein HU200_015653 [Digitaria exilis]